MRTISFVHTADLHLGEPIRGWKWATEDVWKRQEEHMQTFQRLISYVKEQTVPFLFIAGDFLEHGFVTPSLYEFVVDQLLQIPDTHIFISPGNHDPFRIDSVYRQEKWPSHVHIFGAKWESVLFPEYQLEIIGKGFTDFMEREPSLPARTSNVLFRIYLMHGDYQEEKSLYFPIRESDLFGHSVDYVALGHIHKQRTYQLANIKRTLVHYPGSPEARNWKEIGTRTITVGKLDQTGVSLSYIPIHTRAYESMEVDVSGCMHMEQLLERVVSAVSNMVTSCYLLIHLIGRCELGDDPRWLHILENKLVQHYKWITIEDHTLPEYDLSYLRNQTNFIASFITLMEQKMDEEQDIERQKIIQLALYRGLDAIQKGDAM